PWRSPVSPDGGATPVATVTRSTAHVAHQVGAQGTAGPPELVRRLPRPEECWLARKVPADHASGEGHRTVLAGAPPRRPLLLPGLPASTCWLPRNGRTATALLPRAAYRAARPNRAGRTADCRPDSGKRACAAPIR